MALPCLGCEAPIATGDDRCPACGTSVVVAGEWCLRELLGRGPGGPTYRATHRRTGKVAAVKVHGPSSRLGWDSREAFERGARTLRGLKHAKLPQVHALVQDEAGRVVLVREHFEGGTLQDRIAEHHRHLDRDEVEPLLRGLLEVLLYLHSRIPLIVHRDIKPANIMFRDEQRWSPVLVDFDVAADHARIDKLEVFAPSPYAAPEQEPGDTRPSVDLYAVGACLLFALTHREPDELAWHDGTYRHEDLLANVDHHVRRVILKLAHPDPKRRYDTAIAALEDLDRAVGASLEPVRLTPLARTGVVVLVGIGLGAAVLLLAGVLAALKPNPKIEPPSTAVPQAEPDRAAASKEATAAPTSTPETGSSSKRSRRKPKAKARPKPETSVD